MPFKPYGSLLSELYCYISQATIRFRGRSVSPQNSHSCSVSQRQLHLAIVFTGMREGEIMEARKINEIESFPGPTTYMNVSLHLR